METTFFLGRETLLATGRAKLATWRKRLFIVMARNAQTASAFFGLPPNRVVEMGAQIRALTWPTARSQTQRGRRAPTRQPRSRPPCRTAPAPVRRRRARPSSASRSAPSASSTATSGRARSTRSRSASAGPTASPPTPANVLGVLSLVFWAMTFVVTFKYLSFVMRADNRGEGGILALMALVGQKDELEEAAGRLLLVLGLFGAALLYGDGVITPAISVLGAVEGVAVAAPAARAPGRADRRRRSSCSCSCSSGAAPATVGAVFGPVMVVWFVTIAALGIRGIALEPRILAAPEPGARGGVLRTQRGPRVPRPRRGGARHHRRRGAVRGHGPLREAADPARLARVRDAGASSSTTSARARCSCATPPRRAARSTCSRRSGRTSRSSPSRPRRRSSRARR